MIKNYVELNEEEKNSALELINRNSKDNKSLEELEKAFNIKVYDYGNGVLFYLGEGRVLGKISVVLEVARILNAAYIYHLDILEEARDKEKILKELIDEGYSLAKSYGAERIVLGILKDEMWKVAENIGLYKQYGAFNMSLEDRDKRGEILELVPLSQDNVEEYVHIYYDSFSDMPHGACTTIEEVHRRLKNDDPNSSYFMVNNKDINIGFMEVTIEGDRGYFDIGLCKTHRGKGYGKKLLETAIDFLNNKKVDNICLTVIEKNKVAYEMYKKRGFKVDKVISYWVELGVDELEEYF